MKPAWYDTVRREHEQIGNNSLMTIQALPYIAFTAFLFGTTLIASRFSVGQFHPLTYIAIRLLIASSGHIMIYLVSRRAFPRDPELWKRAILFGVFGTALNLVGIVSSLQYLSSGLTSVLLTTSPAATALFAHIFLPEERLNRSQWGGVFLALGGALMLTLAGENGLPEVSPDIRGYLLVAVAIVAGSSMTIYARRALAGYDHFDAASIRMFTATVTVVPMAMLIADFDVSGANTQGLIAVLYAACIGTFGGFFMQLYIIKRFGAVASGMTPYLLPIVAIIGGVIILDETFTPLMLVAMLIIFSGIGLIQKPGTFGRVSKSA